MALPETPQAGTPAQSRPRSMILLVWMILAQFMTVLLITAAILFAIFISLEGGGGLAGGKWTLFEAAFYLPLLLLIPLVVSWVVYKRKKRLAVILTTLSFFLIACPSTVGVLMVAFSH